MLSPGRGGGASSRHVEEQKDFAYFDERIDSENDKFGLGFSVIHEI